ncbi:hypothetical protein BTJ68_08741 [Hortaea werneckii EXF-2000]|uniref:pectin lyase n=3 Tax=Hortaea werneckii TaxID=91943 RepID=A0A1Z5T4N1_HORWE|nr:hypothetical protein BTJ68_08741 [Hortaea werneckii EXF-2000]
MQQFTTLAVALAAIGKAASAASVSGSPEGYGASATGGAAGSTVTPTSIDELTSYLTSDEALTVVLTQTFDFRGTEGTASETGCAPYGTGSSCQIAINKDDWCTNYQPDAPSVDVSYDKAALNPIEVASDKTIIGEGSSGVILGKGLRMSNGVNNIIIQNIAISELNPQYVWGGDAITLDGSSNVWVDHVKTSLIGRQHIVTGNSQNTGVTISNNFVDGTTSWSANCNSYHYWAVYMTGTEDTITFKGNYIYHTSGRSPKLGANAVVHMPNNYWDDINGHALEGESAYALIEGSVFQDVTTTETDWSGALYAPSSDDSACQSALGRSCYANSYSSADSLSGSDSSVLSQIGRNAADCDSADNIGDVPNNAGNTL